MVRLFLIRHGETSWNRESRYISSTDLDLTEKGKAQVLALSKRLAGESISRVYSSPLRRACQTAKAIAEPHGLRVKVLRDLREVDFGFWEGLTYGEIKGRYGDLIDRWSSDPTSVAIPGGESWLEVVERVREVFRKIFRENPESKVAVVTHGGVIKCMISNILDTDRLSLWKIRQDSASLTIVDLVEPDKGTLSLLNDTCHLGNL